MNDDLLGTRARSVVVALAMMSLVAAVLAVVYGRKLTDPPPAPRDSYSRGPLGHRAFVEILSGLGLHVTRWHAGDPRRVSGPMLFIEPDETEGAANAPEPSLAEVIAGRRERGYVSVLVAPKWTIDLMGSGRTESDERIEEVLAASKLPVALTHAGAPTDRPKSVRVTSPAGAAHALRLPWPQTVQGAPVEIVGTDRGSLVVTDEERLVYVITDPDLLHNFNVQRADHAALLDFFVREVLRTHTLAIDETFHGHRETRSLAEALGTFPGVLVLVHGLFVVVCVLAMGRIRFGVPRTAPAPLGRGPREAITVSADVLALGQPLARLATRYVENLVLDVHRRLGLPDEGDVAKRALAIDAVATRRALPAEAATLVDATYAAAAQKRPRAAELFALARRAHVHRRRLLGRRDPREAGEEAR